MVQNKQSDGSHFGSTKPQPLDMISTTTPINHQKQQDDKSEYQ